MINKNLAKQAIASPRHLARLRDYDYSQSGAYFVTICSNKKLHIFGDVIGEQMELNRLGQLVKSCWLELPSHYPQVNLDAFGVMPDHIHGILILNSSYPVAKTLGAGLKPAPTKHALPEIVRGFKTFSAKRINQERSTPGTPIWQRNYYEHVIRGESELNKVRDYINTNPLRSSLEL